MPDEMDEIIEDFIVETDEILESLDEKFVELEKDMGNQPLLNEIFRNVHTIKGAAGFLGFNQMVELTHATENVLKKLKEGELPLTSEIMDVILESVDYMKKILNHIRKKDGVEEEISGVISKLTEIDQGKTGQDEKAETKRIGEILTEEGKVSPDDVEEALKIQEVCKESVETEETPRVGEILTATGKTTEDAVEEALKKQKKAEVKSQKVHVEQTIRVDVERLDEVLNLVGELVLGRNRLLKITSNLETRYPEDPEIGALNETMAFLNLITTDLQLAVMKTRMQPVKKVFNKFPRMVRDLARSRSKEVELIISGEETEVDKSVIENIADPLVHIIRNAIDHGIETVEERRSMGKPEQGSIHLSAAQEGNNILIQIKDDGRGIDHDLIKKKAVDKGLITPGQAETLSEQDALELLFMPGFSTASQVTDISGRGVGMDVVKTNIGKLKGNIEIQTEKGRGTTFIIRLPLTLAIIQTLMVEVKNEVYAIPLSSVVETVRFRAEEIRTVNHQEVVQLRGEVLPLVRLGEVLGYGGRNGSPSCYVVVVDEGKKKFGIIVDGLRGQEEVVIKPIEGELIRAEETELIAGATITGEGKVVLIIDLSMLLDVLAKGALANA